MCYERNWDNVAYRMELKYGIYRNLAQIIICKHLTAMKTTNHIHIFPAYIREEENKENNN